MPRLLRAARQGLVPTQRHGNRTLFSEDSIDQLRRIWGSAPDVEGLSRHDMFVLAALSRHPRGLRSVRAVARAARVSPTAASAALRRLVRAGLVDRVGRAPAILMIVGGVLCLAPLPGRYFLLAIAVSVVAHRLAGSVTDTPVALPVAA